jgi:hypothetical protein
LYDHQTDPAETKNVVESANPGTVTELSDKLKAGWRSAMPHSS